MLRFARPAAAARRLSRRALTRTLLASAVLLVACGDEPAGPSGTLEVLPDSATLEFVTDSVVVQAMLDGKPMSGLLLSVTSQTRDVASLPVLDGEALERGVLRAAGPGTASVRVRAGGATGTLFARVAPAGPTVFGLSVTAHATGPDTVSLLGSRLDEIPLDAAITVGGQAHTAIARQQTLLRFLLPRVEQETCSGGALRLPLAVTGAALVPGLDVPAGRQGELLLEPGEYRMLADEDAGCVRLPATGGEYALAWVDLRQEVKGRTGWAGFSVDPYTVAVRDRTVPDAAGAASRRLHSITQVPDESRTNGHLQVLEPAVAATACSDYDFAVGATFWCRSKPWAVGDAMRIRRPGSFTDTVTATVWKVFDGRFPFAVVDGDDSDNLHAFKAAIEAAMPHVLATSVPLYESVFGDVLPVSSRGSGQLLTIIGDFQHSSVGHGCCPEEAGLWSVVTLGSWHPNWESEMVYLLTHEFAHAWQMEWYYATRTAGGGTGPTGIWAIEGGADLLTFEAVRRYSGVPWRANRGIMSFTDGGNRDGPLVRELGAGGDIALGYEHGSSFLRDIVARMVAAGATLDEAYREVTLGALEDWHGWDFQQVRRTGFTERIRTHLGAAWTPGDAILLYTLSQAADDLVPSATLQNPFYLRAGTDPLGDGFGKHRLRAGEGGELSIGRIGTSTGFVRLLDQGGGASFSFASDQPHSAWAIARIR